MQSQETSASVSENVVPLTKRIIVLMEKV